eukprot:scaffold91266_cov19-Tisochrysis_lutea.AAC.1
MEDALLLSNWFSCPSCKLGNSIAAFIRLVGNFPALVTAMGWCHRACFGGLFYAYKGHNSAKTSMINQLDVCARVLIRVGGGNAVKLLTNPILKLTFKCVADL